MTELPDPADLAALEDLGAPVDAMTLRDLVASLRLAAEDATRLRAAGAAVLDWAGWWQETPPDHPLRKLFAAVARGPG